MNLKITVTRLAVIASLLFVLCYNFSFFRHVTAVYPISWANAGFLLSLAAGLTTVIVLLISLLSSQYTIKFILTVLFILSSISAYFMDNFNIVIDKEMIKNIFETSHAEVADLLGSKLLLYIVMLGVMPSIFICKIDVFPSSLKKSVIDKIASVFISIIILFVLMMPFSKFYTSFFREHKPLRYYANPVYFIYSFGKYIDSRFKSSDKTIALLGVDAKILSRPHAPKKLVIFVVGEAARADHFSLNGYPRETNPLLRHEGVINFSKMQSCGTSTAYSVPCMFSHLTRSEYSEKKAQSTENVLDILRKTGSVSILWRDNNSDSKGVALRVPYEDFRNIDRNPVCADGECRDEGMLTGLDRYVEQNKDKDILIVLHQMGNHGPAYYKRYPNEFKIFNPVCATNEIEKCSNEEIVNTYDNTLRYTDYFLYKIIEFLKNNQERESCLFYVSDHGESLGEGGLYLHGIPYVIAPEAQTHVGALLWLDGQTKRHLDMNMIESKKNMQASHDSIFHTLLGLFDVQTNVYKKDLDLLH